GATAASVFVLQLLPAPLGPARPHAGRTHEAVCPAELGTEDEQAEEDRGDPGPRGHEEHEPDEDDECSRRAHQDAPGKTQRRVCVHPASKEPQACTEPSPPPCAGMTDGDRP